MILRASARPRRRRDPPRSQARQHLLRRNDGVAKVTDFGIAKGEEDAKAGRGVTKGSSVRSRTWRPSKCAGEGSRQARRHLCARHPALRAARGTSPFRSTQRLRAHAHARRARRCRASPRCARNPARHRRCRAARLRKKSRRPTCGTHDFSPRSAEPSRSLARSPRPCVVSPSPRPLQPFRLWLPPPLVAPARRPPIHRAPPSVAPDADRSRTQSKIDLRDRRRRSIASARTQTRASPPANVADFGCSGPALRSPRPAATARLLRRRATIRGYETDRRRRRREASKAAAIDAAAGSRGTALASRRAGGKLAKHEQPRFYRGARLRRHPRVSHPAGFPAPSNRLRERRGALSALGRSPAAPSEFAVEDRLRPTPPAGVEYDHLDIPRFLRRSLDARSRARSCAPQFDGASTLTVDVAQIRTTADKFKTQGKKVVSCVSLAAAPADPIESKLSRVP